MTSTETLFHKIATHVKKRRQDQGWSQQELAARSGVSRRMIVLIEQAESNVSLATLDKIAGALELSFAQLINGADPEPLAIIPQADMPLIWQSGQSHVRLVVSGPASQSAELWHWSLAPGDHYEAEPDPLGVEELLHVIQGQLRLQISETSYALGAGDAIRFGSQQPYTYTNVGPETLIFSKIVLT